MCCSYDSKTSPSYGSPYVTSPALTNLSARINLKSISAIDVIQPTYLRMSHHNVYTSAQTTDVACCRLERTLVGCTDPPF